MGALHPGRAHCLVSSSTVRPPSPETAVRPILHAGDPAAAADLRASLLAAREQGDVVLECEAGEWLARAWREQVDTVAEEFDPKGAWPTWVLSNHDNPRHATRYGSEARARAAAVLLLGLRGTPFLYAGEELGLEDAVVPPEREVDPGGRDGCRAPVPWTTKPHHGWGVEDAWLPWPPGAAERSVEAEREEPTSVLHLYRRMVAARRESEALRLGSFSWAEAPAGVLAFERSTEGDHRVVLVNFLPEPAPGPVGLVEGFEVEVASDGSGEGRPFSGELGPDQALVLRPAAGVGAGAAG
ncbi:MAG: hypothetical protein KY439_11400 [Actinobacteria bacterium]|nr:hypothetical protein [Actinomycetota bacterium]